MTDVEFGLDTFGGVTVGADGKPQHHAQVIRDVVADGVLADQVGLDFFGVGEHHRPDFAVSSPEMVLAAVASKTDHIRLGSAVTVLSSDDPVRVFERFATLDAVSNGRAEIVAGRGSFIESFGLFGFDTADYEILFEERLALLKELLIEKPVTWSGSTRAALTNQEVFPKTENGLRAWVGVGGTPESVVRAARHGFGLFLAIIGGPSDRFLPYVDLFERAQDQFAVARQPVAVHSPGFVAETDEKARTAVYDGWLAMRTKIGAERGWPAPRPGDFEREVENGALYVGSPETVARKIASTVRTLGVNRFDLKYDQRVSHDHLLSSIELYGTKVVPLVKDMLAS
jgi:probable LLM family oxidoreductase